MTMSAISMIKELIHWVNGIFHKEPFNFLIDGLYWWFILLFVCPLAAFGNAILTWYRLGSYLVGMHNASFESPSSRRKQGDNDVEEEIAIVVTGCDSGFGKELSFELASKGFVVFTGCLSEESFKQFEGQQGIIPLKMDVTSDDEVSVAYETVHKWLSFGEDEDKSQQGRRFLHALVNNAGIGIAGLVDFLDVSDYQKVMDVNFFGIIRCCKAFLPIFKHQAVNKLYNNHGRIINIVSAAGLIAPMTLSSTYGSSKYAAECLTINMHQEFSLFGIKVTGFNPSFHSTPICDSIHDRLVSCWDNLPKEKQEEYGPEWADLLHKLKIPLRWRSHIVIDEVVKCLLLKNPPPKVLVGTDAKFAFTLFSKVPLWITLTALKYNFLFQLPKPAIMKQQSQQRKDDEDRIKKHQ